MMEWFKARYADYDRQRDRFPRGERGAEYVPIAERRGLWSNYRARLVACIVASGGAALALGGMAAVVISAVISPRRYVYGLERYGLSGALLFIGVMALVVLVVAVLTVIQTIRHHRRMEEMMKDVETPLAVQAAIDRAAIPSVAPLPRRERLFGGRRWLYWVFSALWGSGFLVVIVHVLSGLGGSRVDAPLVMSAILWIIIMGFPLFLLGLPFLLLVKRFVR